MATKREKLKRKKYSERRGSGTFPKNVTSPLTESKRSGDLGGRGREAKPGGGTNYSRAVRKMLTQEPWHDARKEICYNMSRKKIGIGRK